MCGTLGHQPGRANVAHWTIIKHNNNNNYFHAVVCKQILFVVVVQHAQCAALMSAWRFIFQFFVVALTFLKLTLFMFLFIIQVMTGEI